MGGFFLLLARLRLNAGWVNGMIMVHLFTRDGMQKSDKSPDDKNPFVDALGDAGLTKRKRVQNMMPMISDAIDRGHSIKAIHSKVKDVYGLTISYAIFIQYVRFELEHVREVVKVEQVVKEVLVEQALTPKVKLTKKEIEQQELDAVMDKLTRGGK